MIYDKFLQAGKDEPDYIGRILEFFETYDGQLYFSARWYFRPEDTVCTVDRIFLDYNFFFYWK